MCLFEATLRLDMKSSVTSFEVLRMTCRRASVRCEAIEVLHSHKHTANPVFAVDLRRLLVYINPSCLCEVSMVALRTARQSNL